MSLDRAAIHNQVAEEAPIEGIKFVDIDDPATWVIDFAPEATTEEQAAAQAVIDGIDLETMQTPLEMAQIWLQDNPGVANVLRMTPDEIETTIGAYDLTQLRTVVIAQAVLLSFIARIVRQ